MIIISYPGGREDEEATGNLIWWLRAIKMRDFAGCVFSLVVKLLVNKPASHITCTWVWYLSLTTDSSFLLIQILGDNRDGSSSWISANQVGELDCIPSFWHWPGPDSAIVDIWQANCCMGCCISPSQIKILESSQV